MRTQICHARPAAALAVAALITLPLTGCGKSPTSPRSSSTPQPDIVSAKRAVQISSMTADQVMPYLRWEIRYALSQRVNGTSALTRNGLYMGDWNYPTGGSDNSAFSKVSADYAGATGSVGFSTYEQGGWCKFFVSLVLFRCSYGLGNGYHLVLPYGYTYATTDPRYAAPGWVLQSTSPHTAFIDSPHYNPSGVQDGWWLIDSNWIGTYKDAAGTLHYSYWVGKHAMTFAELSGAGLKAWKPTLMRQY